jgi:L-threonylcarbamoyladenylate synthase
MVGVESTVLDLSGNVPTILRPGAITREMLTEILPRVDLPAGAPARESGEAMPSPGLLEKHYSPRTPLTLYEGDASAVVARMTEDARVHAQNGRRVGIVAADEDPFAGGRVVRLGPGSDLATVASRLYAALRDLDASGVDVILVRSFPADAGLGLAVQDRLRRAAAGRLVHC